MKRTITLHHQRQGYTDRMFNIAVKYGIHYKMIEEENANVMVFTLREEIEDVRTTEYFQELLCRIFETEPANSIYPASDVDVSIYTILLAFVDMMRNEYNDKHYREALKRFHDARHIDMIGSLPSIHKLKNGSYSLTPITHEQVGYEVISILSPEKLKGNTQAQSKARDKHKRAVYRNFDWDNLYECCNLYREFCDGEELYDAEQVFLLARNICGAENGKKQFLKIMNEQHSDSIFADLNWKEILTTIIKGNVPLASCQECAYCEECQHTENMLSTAQPQRFEVRKIRDEKYVSLEEVSDDLHAAFDRAISAQDNHVRIIKAQTGAGKTETYLQCMKHSEKPLLIAVPTHELKKEIYRKSVAMGIENICCTPDLEEYQLSEELRQELNNLYAIGAGAYVLKYLTEQLLLLKHHDSDYVNISQYLDNLKRSTRSTGHIITTHARLLYMAQEVLNSHEVIIDEDILRTAMNTNCVSMKDLHHIRNMGVFKGDARCRIEYLCRNRGYRKLHKIDLDKDEKLLGNLGNISSDICGVLGAEYVYITDAMVHYLSDIPLPSGKLTILSATADAELYQRFYPDRQFDFYKCKKAKYMGKIRQHTDCSYSSYILEKHPEKVSALYQTAKEDTVITFKGIEQEFHTNYHFGNVEGLNLLSGKNLSVIGLPNKPDFVYCLYGMRAGLELKKSPNMYVHRIEQGGYSFSLNTFQDSTLQRIQTWMLSSQLEQAVGRARLLRNDCMVTVYAGFPVEQAVFN
ncbi:MAG: DEAD/DEAH box helicase family protein [Ruminococcus sp.]|nr:DEAD/DEAH box helicase family protein [Ruminococcus sp.]